ncbi:hypothetical protein GIB67_040411, partial [Kingdonia uniflora]
MLLLLLGMVLIHKSTQMGTEDDAGFKSVSWEVAFAGFLQVYVCYTNFSSFLCLHVNPYEAESADVDPLHTGEGVGDKDVKMSQTNLCSTHML